MSAKNDSAASKPSLLAIGNFDGVHRGHRYLVSNVIEEARQLSLVPKVLTFHPHPAQVLGRATEPVLTRLPHKLAALHAVSPELEVVVETFDLNLAAMSPREFAERVLVERHAARRVVVGENFRFGKGRAGDLGTLKELGEQLGFSADALPLLTDGDATISSTRIRSLLKRGDVSAARTLLGRPHVLWGRVVRGQQLGRTLGFPTANLSDIEELLPKEGVYACRVQVEGGASGIAAVCNIGTRPTLGDGELCVEVHLLDGERDLYDRCLGVALEQRLRDERAFADLQQLRIQIESDVAAAAAVLKPPSVAPPKREG